MKLQIELVLAELKFFKTVNFAFFAALFLNRADHLLPPVVSVPLVHGSSARSVHSDLILILRK
jgi:hypothetical protein